MQAYTEVECYKTYDGKLFECEKAAQAHADDLLGVELDGLLKLFKLDITRTQEYRALLGLLKNRQELARSIRVIHSILTYGE